VGAYAIQLAKAERLTVIGDAGSISDEALVRSWGVDHVVPRGPGFSAAVHDAVGAGAAGLIDCANLAGLALPAIADSGGMVTLRGWTGPSTRGIVIHPISSMGATQSTPAFERLVEAAEDGTLTLRVADVLPAERAADAHRRLAAGGVRGRIVLDFGSLS
jgi:NADPH:quinone reductase-like Zn-dependent oxidoreductase